MKKTQIILIHGGTTFSSEEKYLNYLRAKKVSLKKRKDWAEEYLDKKLGNRFEVIRPRMPLREKAAYRDWKIFFEHYLPSLEDKCILIGNSLGGIFLAKYLSENTLPKKALSVFLVCPPFDNTSSVEELAGGFELENNLSRISQNCEHLHLLFSKDDPVVPVVHADKYRALLPNADIAIYANKNGHFRVEKFPEIIDLIRKDIRNIGK